MMAAETVAAREAEEMAVEMESEAREEASAAVVWEVGNQEGHSNGHSSLQRGSSPSSACAMMQRRCAPVVRFLVEKPRALCNPMNRHGAKEVHRHMKPHTVHVNSLCYDICSRTFDFCRAAFLISRRACQLCELVGLGAVDRSHSGQRGSGALAACARRRPSARRPRCSRR